MTGGRLSPFRINGRRELAAVAAIWLGLGAMAWAAIAALNTNALGILRHIETVAAGRYVRTQVLYEEARKRAAAALEKASALNRDSAVAVALPASDPDLRAAFAAFDRALALDPTDPFSAEHGAAYQTLLSLREAAGDPAGALDARARDAMCRGDFTSAISDSAALSAAETTGTRAPDLAVELALRLRRADEATSALARLTATGAAAPARLAHLRSRISETAGDIPAAANAGAEAAAAAPDDVDLAKRAAGLLSRAGRGAEALALLEARAGKGQAPRDAPFLHLLGDARIAAGKPRDALTALKTAALLEPTSGEVQWSLARAHLAAGDPRRSDQARQRAGELNPALRAKSLNP